MFIPPKQMSQTNVTCNAAIFHSSYKASPHTVYSSKIKSYSSTDD